MEPEQHDAHSSRSWFAALSGPRKVLAVIVALVVVAFVLQIAMVFLGAMLSVGRDDVGYVPQSLGGGSPNSASIDFKSYGEEYDMVRSTSAPAPDHGDGVGLYEEAAYESISYSASYKTRDYDTLCGTFESWKAQSTVVMLYASRGERYCSYRFKVPKADAERFVADLEALDPDTMNVDTTTLKKQVVDHESALDVLLRKQAMLQTMLNDATAAYDELAALATGVQDVESLTTIINSKLDQINQLTREMQSVSGQIDAMARSAGELQDRIDFVYFNVDVTKYQVVDGSELKDSWVYQAQRFVRGANEMLQDMTLGFALTLLRLVSVLLYVLVFGAVALVVGKYGWRAGRAFWRR